MADIDLIPRDYIALRRLRRWLRRFAMVIALMLVLAGGARAWLAWRLGSERPIVEALSQGERAATERQSRLAVLRARKLEADAHLGALRDLRDATTWERLFRAIDAAHHADIWFEALHYERDATLEPPAGATTPPAASALQRPTLGHRFEIQAHALGHPAVTQFMRALGGRPGIGELRLAETAMRRLGSVDVVDFKLTGTIEPQRKASP